MRPTSLMSSGCRPCTPRSYAACSPVSMICVVDFLARLVDDFLDAARMDASVGHELLERQARDLAAHRIEARDDDRVRRVVDDDVDAGRELERADVSAFAADDAALHLVVRQRRRPTRWSRRVCSAAIRWIASAMIFFASRSAFRFAVSRISRMRLAASACASSSIRRISSAFASCGRHAGHLLEPAALFADQLLELLLALGDGLLAAAEVARRGVPSSLSRCSSSSNLRSSTVFALGDAALFALDLFAAAADLDFQLLAELDELFLSGDDGALPQVLGFALGVADDSLRCLFGGGLRRGLSSGARLRPPILLPTKKKAGRQYERSTPSAAMITPCSSYGIYAPPRRGRRTGEPLRPQRLSRRSDVRRRRA